MKITGVYVLPHAAEIPEMIWLCVAILVGTLIVLAGRAHSRHLDRLENLLADAALANKKRPKK